MFRLIMLNISVAIWVVYAINKTNELLQFISERLCSATYVKWKT